MPFEKPAAGGKQEEKNTQELYEEIAQREKGFIEKFQGKAREMAKAMTLISGLSLGTACENPYHNLTNEIIGDGDKIPTEQVSEESTELVNDLLAESARARHFVENEAPGIIDITAVGQQQTLIYLMKKQIEKTEGKYDYGFTGDSLDVLQTRSFGGDYLFDAPELDRAGGYEAFAEMRKVIELNPEKTLESLREAEIALYQKMDANFNGVLDGEEQEALNLRRIGMVRAFDEIGNTAIEIIEEKNQK